MDRAACRIASLLVFMLAALTASFASADDMYVTDQLLVGIYPDRSLAGSPVKLLKSGTKLEIVQRDGQVVEVKTGDNKQGWLKASYLTLEPPALAQLAKSKKKVEDLNTRIKRLWTKTANAENSLKKSEAENLKLQQQLDQLTSQSASGKSHTDTLNQQLNQLREERDGLTSQLEQISGERDSLANSNAELESELESVQGGERWKWYAIAFTVTFVIGLIAGIALLDKIHRSRHGGFRI